MRTWFNITNAAGEAATIAIFDEIGMWGITAADFSRELKAVSAPVINLEINSPGGSVFDGIAIYNMLRASGKTINAKVMGVAASIASVILMAADKITMPSNAMVMVHAPSGGLFGTADEMREMADVLDKIQANLVGVYMKRTGKSEDDIKALLATDTWLTAAEAKDMGFADEVLDPVEAKASFDLERLPEAARLIFKAAAAPAADPADPDGDGDGAPTVITTTTTTTWVTFADQVTALLKGGEFEAHAASWAVAFTKPDEITARIAECREIKALFALAKHADKADGVITAGKSLPEARIALQELMAAADEHIDTSKPVKKDDESQTGAISASAVYAGRTGKVTEKDSSQPTNRGPVGGSSADIWARRNRNQ